MSESRPFHKLPECTRCGFFNADSPYLCCSLHPDGVQEERCPDFQEGEIVVKLQGESEGQWEPEGANYYGDELVITPQQRWSWEEKLDLLNWHPLFTGRCPACEMPMFQTEPPRVHWDCTCGWMDDSI